MTMPLPPGAIAMNKNHLAICAALLSIASMPSMAQEYKYRLSTNRVSGFVEVGKSTKSVTSSEYWGKYFQWFGNPQECSSSGTVSCTYTRATSFAVATSWKIGTQLAAKETYPMGEMTAQLSSELSVLETDTDTFTVATTFNPGYTALPSTFIERDKVVYTIKGVWVRDKNGVLCRPVLSLLPICDRYVWTSGAVAGTVTTLKRKWSEQTFRYYTYPNGQRPSGLRLE
jgi:hypothetical protein